MLQVYPFTAGWAHMCAQTFHITGASERIAVGQHCKHVSIEGPQHSRMISCKASANAEMDTAHGANIKGRTLKSAEKQGQNSLFPCCHSFSSSTTAIQWILLLFTPHIHTCVSFYSMPLAGCWLLCC